MKIFAKAVLACLIMFYTATAPAMTYLTPMDEQDTPRTTDMTPWVVPYVYPQYYDDYAHIQPLRCKKECEYFKKRRAEQTKVFTRTSK